MLPLRVRGYRASDIDELCTAGEVVWVGAGALGASDGRIRFFFADQLATLSASLELLEFRWRERLPCCGFIPRR